MAKRRAEDAAPHGSPTKRRYRPLCATDKQPRSAALTGPPPSLLALLGGRCRKRPRYFEEPEKDEDAEEAAAGAALCFKTTRCDARRPAAGVWTVPTSGSFQARRSSGTFTNHKKRPRQDGVGAESVCTKADDEADAETNAEDCKYNSFNYWRVPLPELDLSLLEDAGGSPPAKDKSKDKDSSSDYMES